ncbi:probable alpha,alpha-trehalose-phosphate synthase [UDP-forming] 7 [Humulus lupulus]|uniref:probable alpha,alpha-trehalose-phosphate synthase [UDP-forming] 7 n=1 Tax=Humulus lupulus TaxID=3486 RepID=UPI002B414CD3|nr:probable alpha,alpha-trehalose-phosphate synthase [UDP-forming] 7 [Humulus lupulus]XP_062105830.1 probable alpha,alpha-trehalose-phosphate synthase [UDP-forming] 7 [Humulus lupulus]
MTNSFSNLLDLASGNLSGLPNKRKRFSWAEYDDDDDDLAPGFSSDTQSLSSSNRIIIVANHLPLKAKRRENNKGWCFSLNEDSLLLHLKDGLPKGMEVLYVGSLNVNVDPEEEEDVSQNLLDNFKCVPTFLEPDLSERFYDGFCKRKLWPLFHYMLPLSGCQEDQFEKSLWESYILANKVFFHKVVEIINPKDDYVWIHDYHLMVLPTFLRKHYIRLRMGFFLHSPFPSSEIYRTLPVREEILKALLNSDIIGFHTYDYARHFLSCCSRMLGLNYQLKRGYLGLEYYGRIIGIKIMPIGVHMGRIESLLAMADKDRSLRELKQQFEGKSVLIGVDDIDIFKGINFKLLAMEQMLKQHSHWRGKAVLIQILNPARGKGLNVGHILEEMQETIRRINDEYGQPGYEPIVLINREVSANERVAYYSIADCLVVTAIRDGMNLTPYEYVVCRQGLPESSSCSDCIGPKKSMIVVSEFIGCSLSLSGAIRINPWYVQATSEAMLAAITMRDSEKELRHEKHYQYVSTHDVTYWSRSFFQDMNKTCADQFKKICWGIGISFGFRVVSLDPNFRKLSLDGILSAYRNAKSRAILLDYDGTIMPQNSLNKPPSQDVISTLRKLCADQKNTVFVVSGKGREHLNEWFSSCQNLGVAAEHGYFIRWPQNDEWGTFFRSSALDWMKLAEPVLKLYTEATDGSSIEVKESALVWQYKDADPAFGSFQAQEMLDHLESVLANEPVAVNRGKFIVEIKPQGASKGFTAEKIFSSMAEKGKRADFVLCIGDDRSDEDMFEIFGGEKLSNILSPNALVFACTVGQKPSSAKYYLDSITEVVYMLRTLAHSSSSAEVSVSTM